jgi:hypothetical protein
MSKPKITKLSDLNQVDGRVHKASGETKITRLDQIINANAGLSKYGTLDAEEYANQLATMNIAELRTHALSKAGIMPSQSRERMIKQLIGKFKEHTASYRRPEKVEDQNARLTDEKIRPALDILRHVK